MYNFKILFNFLGIVIFVKGFQNKCIDRKIFRISFLRYKTKSLEIYILLHFLSEEPQTFKKHSFYSLKDIYCYNFKNIKIVLDEKKKKKVLFNKNLIPKLKNFLN